MVKAKLTEGQMSMDFNIMTRMAGTPCGFYNRKVNCCSVKSTGSLVIRRIKFSNFIVTGKQRLTKNFITVVIKPGGCPN
ncbi:Uncharacterised protein [Shigella sonnei]|nr:Uncharacterised protein [Shigella sonnei]